MRGGLPNNTPAPKKQVVVSSNLDKVEAEMFGLTFETFKSTLLKLLLVALEAVRVKRLAIFEHMVNDAGQFMSGSGNGFSGAVSGAHEAIVVTQRAVAVS